MKQVESPKTANDATKKVETQAKRSEALGRPRSFFRKQKHDETDETFISSEEEPQTGNYDDEETEEESEVEETWGNDSPESEDIDFEDTIDAIENVRDNGYEESDEHINVEQGKLKPQQVERVDRINENMMKGGTGEDGKYWKVCNKRRTD